MTEYVTADRNQTFYSGHEPAAVEEILKRMVTGAEDPLVLSTAFIAALRPPSRRTLPEAAAVWRGMLSLLAGNPDYRNSLAETLLKLFADRKERRFYTEAGMLPNSGFFSELRRKLVHKALPEIDDEQDLKDCVHIIFSHKSDQAWADAIPLEDRIDFWKLLDDRDRRDHRLIVHFMQQLLDSTIIMAHRIAAMGLEPELLRVNPRLEAGESPFLALADEVIIFASAYRRHAINDDQAAKDERHLLVMLDQCRKAVLNTRKAAANCGTSMPLTYLIVRLNQHLERLELLVRLLAVRFMPEDRKELAERWSSFIRDALQGERERNSLRKHFSTLLDLISLRVTENAGRTGEHYIAKDRKEWLAIWRAAAGGGFLIAIMALLKLLAASPTRPVLAQGILNGIIYGGGFAVIHMLHFTVATKQPAMTAATIAATVSQKRGKLRDSDQIVDLIVNTVRSQIAAIAGNVMVALPLAIAVGTIADVSLGRNLFTPVKAGALLEDIDPFHSPSLIYAGIAGVWLFVAGIVSGYTDNLASYSDLGNRTARAKWLAKLTGRERASSIGSYLDKNAGGLAGNLFFGFALGLTPAIGKDFGIPLDIRHIAFSSANLGYALTSLDWNVDRITLLHSGLGIFLIGLVNLVVSFALALWVALRSRGVEPCHAVMLLPHLWRAFLRQPGRFLYPAVK